MQIINKKTSDIKEYRNNTKKHDKKQIANVAESIKQYGFVQPIVIDTDNTVVIGHCRLCAARKLRLKEVPCVCVDDLTEEQVNALRIVDNKTNESQWDMDILPDELFDIDLSMFDFSEVFDEPDKPAAQKNDDKKAAEMFDELTKENKHAEEKEKTRERVENILNLGYGQFYSDNADGFPCVDRLEALPDVEEWIPFDFAVREKNPENKGVYFFRDDYRFQRVWAYPEKHLDILQRFKAVISPDFSLYFDTSLILQKFNQYRNRWLTKYWQNNGITVVPLARDSGDRSSFKWCFDGMPMNSWLCFSAMWSDGELAEETVEAFDLMVNKLEPIGILMYGGENYKDRYKADCPIVYIKSFSRSGLIDGD